MDLLQVREKEIFETLKSISKQEFIVIGGYAANAYTLPRFSVDCDIVIKDKEALKKISKELQKIGYVESKIDGDLPYLGEFRRYEKKLEKGFKVSMDILIGKVIDRHTNSIFDYLWIFDNSTIKLLRGKTIVEQLKLRIINPDALIVMKLISTRETDIRDVFMMLPSAKDIEWIKTESKKRCEMEPKIKKIIERVSSKNFRDNLQGVFGYIDEKVFEKHKKAVLELSQL